MLKKSVLVLLVGVLVWFSRLVHKISVGAAQKPPPTSKSNGAFDEATAPAFAEAEAELKKLIQQPEEGD